MVIAPKRKYLIRLNNLLFGKCVIVSLTIYFISAGRKSCVGRKTARDVVILMRTNRALVSTFFSNYFICSDTPLDCELFSWTSFEQEKQIAQFVIVAMACSVEVVSRLDMEKVSPSVRN